MTYPEKTVLKAVKRDIPQLIETLSSAFDLDPVMSWSIRQDNKRPEALKLCFNHLLKDSMRYGEVTCTEDLNGCALWLPPGKWIGESNIYEIIRSLPDILRWMGFGRLNRWITLLQIENRYRPKTPHFYLAFLAVAPSKQGKGYGSSLLNYTLTRLDLDGTPAYLESSNIRNNQLYERFGFKVINEIKIPQGPTEWAMWREPREAI